MSKSELLKQIGWSEELIKSFQLDEDSPEEYVSSYDTVQTVDSTVYMLETRNQDGSKLIIR